MSLRASQDARLMNILSISTDINFSVKECNIIMYLSDYVFGTLYRRIIRSKSGQNKFGIHSLSILLAGKSVEESVDCNTSFVDAKSRGGLWTVIPEIFHIFSNAELHLRASSSNSTNRKIDSKIIVTRLMKNCSVLAKAAES